MEPSAGYILLRKFFAQQSAARGEIQSSDLPVKVSKVGLCNRYGVLNPARELKQLDQVYIRNVPAASSDIMYHIALHTSEQPRDGVFWVEKVGSMVIWLTSCGKS